MSLQVLMTISTIFFIFFLDFRSDYALFQKILKLEFEYPRDFPTEAKDLISKLLVSTQFVSLTPDTYAICIKQIYLFKHR